MTLLSETKLRSCSDADVVVSGPAAITLLELYSRHDRIFSLRAVSIIVVTRGEDGKPEVAPDPVFEGEKVHLD
ncbi:MAG: hypothetical protein EOP09_01615 [Proteobacteria bacterium]|nr:MAG: hypothetical protein EOP09_01615 [Pseudomonadota bacterium]